MSGTAERVMVPGYRHLPGNHCGSTALRNLLGFHGLELSEEMAFGLGAGACFWYFSHDDVSPSRFTNGRTDRLEETFLELTGAPLRLRTDPDPNRSWEMAREVVESGRPSLLLTDLYYLDHYGRSAHFPGHAVVLAGYDPELAYLSDTSFGELQTTRLDHLRQARHARHPAYPLDGHMFDVPEGTELGDLAAAIPDAIERAAQEMLQPSRGEYQGITALRRLADEIESWPAAAQDWRWCARFLYQVIERRGTGGGNFRRMYARFLEEAGYPESSLADEAAQAWSMLAETARVAAEPERPNPEHWRRLRANAQEALTAEQRLWGGLAS